MARQGWECCLLLVTEECTVLGLFGVPEVDRVHKLEKPVVKRGKTTCKDVTSRSDGERGWPVFDHPFYKCIGLLGALGWEIVET